LPARRSDLRKSLQTDGRTDGQTTDAARLYKLMEWAKNITKVACRMSGIQWRGVCFRKLLSDTINEKFSLSKVKSNTICGDLVIQEEICCRPVWRWAQIYSVFNTGNQRIALTKQLIASVFAKVGPMMS